MRDEIYGVAFWGALLCLAGVVIGIPLALGDTFDPNKRMAPERERRMQVAECCAADHEAMGYQGGAGSMDGGVPSYGMNYSKDQSRMTGADPTGDHPSPAAPTGDHPAGYGAGSDSGGMASGGGLAGGGRVGA